MKIFIVACEASADEYGGKLMEQLNDNAEIEYSGIGGVCMEKQGLQSMYELEQLSIMGFFEVLKKILFLKKVENRILKHISTNQINHIVLIDYPGLNLRLCKKIKSISNIPITYYISPQLWAWKEKRIEIIREYVDQMFVIFEFEKNWYKERGVNVHYIGHPFLDIIKKNPRDILNNQYNLNPDYPTITLFPGSRKQELNKHLKIFINAATLLKKDIKNLQIIIGLHPKFDSTIVKKMNHDITIINDYPLKALELADAAIIASGTATLQALLLGTPGIIVYKMNNLSWILTKFFVKVKYAGIVNILANKIIYPELLQTHATPQNISSKIKHLLYDEKFKQNVNKEIIKLQKSIGEKGASAKAAQLILNFNK